MQGDGDLYWLGRLERLEQKFNEQRTEEPAPEQREEE